MGDTQLIYGEGDRKERRTWDFLENSNILREIVRMDFAGPTVVQTYEERYWKKVGGAK